MHLQHLKYLIDLEKTRSISISSENLFLSQQALSKAIKTLETEMGTKLLIRTPKGIGFTEHGQIFLEFAHQFMNSYAAMRNTFLPQKPTNGRQVTMHIYAKKIFFKTFITDAILDFYDIMPEIAISTSSYGSDVICDILQKNPSEKLTDTLSFVSIPYPRQQKAIPQPFRFVPVFQEREYYLAVPISSPLARYKSISLKHIKKLPLVHLSDFNTLNGWPPALENIKQEEETILLKLKTDVEALWLKAIINNYGVGLISGIWHKDIMDSPRYQKALAYIPIPELSHSGQEFYCGYIVHNQAPDHVQMFIEHVLTYWPK